MPTLNVAFFSGPGRSGGGIVTPAAAAPPLLVADVAFTGVSAQSPAAPFGTEIVRIQTDADARIAFGDSPTALASGASIKITAGAPEYYAVGLGLRVAVITSA